LKCKGTEIWRVEVLDKRLSNINAEYEDSRINNRAEYI
jgi:hypothetical protein